MKAVDDYYGLWQRVAKRDGWKCRHCKSRNNLHMHHIVYRSEGGPDESWNLVILCLSCHEGVHRHQLFILSDDTVVGADGELQFERAEGWKPI